MVGSAMGHGRQVNPETLLVLKHDLALAWHNGYSDLDPEQIEPPPKLGTSIHSDFISGIGKFGDDFLIILDLQKVFASEELETLKETKKLAQKETAEVSS